MSALTVRMRPEREHKDNDDFLYVIMAMVELCLEGEPRAIVLRFPPLSGESEPSSATWERLASGVRSEYDGGDTDHHHAPPLVVTWCSAMAGERDPVVAFGLRLNRPEGDHVHYELTVRPNRVDATTNVSLFGPIPCAASHTLMLMRGLVGMLHMTNQGAVEAELNEL